MIRNALGVLSFLLLTPLSQAQTVIYQTNFNTSAGWSASGAGCWSVDDQPSLGGTIYHSAPFSLNCNQSANGDYSGCGDEYAAGPVLDLSQLGPGARLSFWCKWMTENTCSLTAKKVLVVSQSTGEYHVDLCLTMPGACPTDDWHQHEIPLDSAWGQVQLYFYFATYGGGLTILGGWMVDDLVVDDAGVASAYCTPKINSEGCTPLITSSGSPSYSGAGPAFQVHGQGVLSNHQGLMIWGLNQASTPFGGGTLCVGAPVRRTTVQSSGGGGPPTDCSGGYSFACTPAWLQSKGLLPGANVHVQYWSRDSGFTTPQNVGLTAGLSFTVTN